MAAIDIMLDPDYLHGLATLALSDVRSRRRSCSEVEVGLSYFRRLVQGRLDIVLEVARRRQAGVEGDDAASLVQRLPEILGERVHAAGNGRLPLLMAPAEYDQDLSERLDSIMDIERLTGSDRLEDEDLREAIDALSTLEREISATRRSLHAVMDTLQAELVRRYKSGEATVDSLLP